MLGGSTVDKIVDGSGGEGDGYSPYIHNTCDFKIFIIPGIVLQAFSCCC